MHSEETYRFIVIDDDPLNNFICTMNVKKIFPAADVQTFTRPAEGLAYIGLNYNGVCRQNTVLFLDINMPDLSGWEVLDKFAQFSNEVKEQFCVFMLSSSIASSDKKRALDHAHVSDFIEKPLSIPSIQNCLPHCGTHFKIAAGEVDVVV